MNNFITLYQKRLNLQNATFSPIEHEDATVAMVYKVALPTGEHFILKVCTRTQDYAHELYFLKYFADKLPVPRIVQTIEPAADVDGAILMEYLPGELLKPAAFTGKLAYEIGSLLGRIHLNRAAGYGDPTQLNDLNPDPRFYFTHKFDEGLAECSNHLPAVLLEQCKSYFDKHLNLLVAADGPCIIHRDFRPGNLIVLDGKVQGIIDWSSARAGFAQDDFCFLEDDERVIDPAGKDSFLAGYATIRPVPDYQTMMPLLRMSRAIAAIGFTVKRGTWNNSGARLYQFNRRFLDDLFGRLQSAIIQK